MDIIVKTFFAMLWMILCLMPVQAEVITDGSLGEATSLTGPDFDITADLGQQRGANLFHSFSQFNIASNESATFSGPANIDNIISRITGGNASTIDGLLRSNISGANLFLLNPAGVMFGPNARLDLSGSLHVSSADYLRFSNNEEFLATPQVGEVLSSAAPVAFGFLGNDAGAIHIQGANLTLASQSTLTLAANGIELNDAQLQIDQGTVQLSSVASAGEVSIVTGEVSGAQTFADLDINQTEINVDGAGGGRVPIQGDTVRMDNATISSQTTGTSNGHGIEIQAESLSLRNSRIITGTSDRGDAGDIQLIVTNLTLDQHSNISSGSVSVGQEVEQERRVCIPFVGCIVFIDTVIIDHESGNTGDITISTDQVELNDQSEIAIYSNAENHGTAGNAGDIYIQAGTRLSLDRSKITVSTSATSSAGLAASGDAGAITIQAGVVDLSEGSQISATTEANAIVELGTIFFGPEALTGNTGTIRIQADSLTLRTSSKLLTNTTSRGFLDSARSGRGGDIELQVTENIEVRSGSQIVSGNILSASNAGNVSIESGKVLVSGDSIDATDIMDTTMIGSYTAGDGDAGDVRIQASDVIVGDISSGQGSKQAFGEGIASASVGRGNAGDLVVETDRLLVFGDGNSVTGMSTDAFDIMSDDLRIDELLMFGAFDPFIELINFIDSISSAFDTPGNAGDILINANVIEMLNGSVISSSSIAGAQGDAGTITIETNRLSMFGGLTPSPFQDDNLIDLPTSILTVTDTEGDAGEIVIHAAEIEIWGQAGISSNTLDQGDAGNVTVETDGLLIVSDGENSFTGIHSDALGSGDAGLVTVHAKDIEMRNGGFISSNSFAEGEAGTVIVTTGRLLMAGGGNVEINGFPTNVDTAIVTAAAGSGNAGDILVQAREIELQDGAVIASSTVAGGDAGSVTIQTGQLKISGKGRSEFYDTGILSNSLADSSGDAGSIQVTAHDILLSDDVTISSASAGSGQAGSVTIKADGDVSIHNRSSISTETVNGFDPLQPASIQITARNLLLEGSSSITTNANGTADAGNITLHVDDTIRIFGHSRLSTESTGGGGGQITVWVDELLHLKDSEITTSVAQGRGNGGDIFVDPVFIILDNSSIIAQAFAGDGGNINLIADYIIQSSDSIIDASSQLGIDGEVDIQALDAEVAADEENISADFLDATRWVKQACAQRSGTGVSSFVVTQRDPRPSPFEDWSASPLY